MSLKTQLKVRRTFKEVFVSTSEGAGVFTERFRSKGLDTSIGVFPMDEARTLSILAWTVGGIVGAVFVLNAIALSLL